MSTNSNIFSVKKLNSRDLALISLFIALQIVLTRFCSIQTPIVRIDLNFLAVSMCAAIFGPIWGGIAAALADFIGVILVPTGGAYFPGFTLTMFLAGFTYGVFLYNSEKTYVRISFAVVIVTMLLNLGLDTVWITMITGKGFLVVLPARVIKCIVMTPIQIILIRMMWKSVGARVSAMLSNA